MRQAVPKKGSQLGFRANADCLAEIEREFLFKVAVRRWVALSTDHR